LLKFILDFINIVLYDKVIHDLFYYYIFTLSQCQMIIFLHGQDNFRSLQQLKKVIASFEQKKSGDIIIIEAQDFNFGKFKNHLQTQGLFKSDKLIVLKNLILESDKNQLNKIKDLLQSKSADTAVIFYERDRVDKRSSLFKILTNLSTIKGKIYYPEFRPLDSNQLRRWIVCELKKSNKTIEPQALNFVLDACANSWQAYAEIGKLIVQPQNHITLNDVQALVIGKIDDNIFHLTDALGQRNLSQALKLLNNQIKSGAEPLYLLAMIARQIKILIKIKSAQVRLGSWSNQQLANEICEHPFVVQKTLPSAKVFTLEKLTQVYNQILQTDIKLKSSPISPQSLLSKLVYDIIN